MRNKIGLFLRSLFRRRQTESELDEELAYHLEKRTEEYLAQGLASEDARRAALRAMDNIELRKEECRDARGITWIEDTARDLRYAVRTLARSPGFTIVVVLSLALGIGANTAIFSVVDALMLRMLPVREPQQLVRLTGTAYSEFLRSTVPFDAFPHSVYESFRDQNDVFTGVICIGGLDHPEVGVDGQSDSAAEVQLVSGNYFSELGVGAAHGRLIAPEDDRAASPAPVVVISYGYWQRQFALDRSVIGKQIRLNNVSLTVIGVTTPRFFGISLDRPPDLWMPYTLRAQLDPAKSSGDLVRVIARLKPGANLQHAAAAVNVLYGRLPEEMRFRKGNSQTAVIHVVPGGRGYSVLREEFSQSLTILMIVVGLVLLTACANVASLLLARATARRSEIRTRIAIGAGRARVVRQLLTESLLLAAAGGTAGLALAVWGNHALLALLPERSRPGTLMAGQSPLAMELDTRILAFTAVVSLLTGILFGLVPALRATRVNLAQGVRSASDSRGGLRLNKLLVVSQVAMSLVLLMAAGLFLRTLDKLRNVDLGFNPQGLIQVSIGTREAGYRGPQVAILYKQLLDRLAAIPSVTSVSGVRNGLIQNGTTSTSIFVPGLPPPVAGEEGPVESADVGPRFFETAGLPLITGRDFSLADDAGSPKVVIINEALARRYFPGRNPLGQRVGTSAASESMCEIIGIAKDARIVTLRRSVAPAMYFPALQRNPDRVNAIEIRTAGDPAGVVAAARREVQAINSKLLISVKTMPQQIDDVLAQERMIGKLSGVFGLLALLLASGGLYGLMAYSVARRTGEIGIRMALGAQRGNVLRMVLRETGTLVLVGVAIGVPVTYAATRIAGHWIEGLLFEMKATDLTTMALASLTLGLVALLAGVIPARRASRLDPMAALRYE